MVKYKDEYIMYYVYILHNYCRGGSSMSEVGTGHETGQLMLCDKHVLVHLYAYIIRRDIKKQKV